MNVTWSGFFTPYTETKVKAVAPESAGVYLLWVQLKTEKWKCFYAGQASNLKSRLLEHLSINEENKCIKTNVNNYICGFEFAKVAIQNDRDGIERYLIDYYNPECNNYVPNCKPIEINLP